MPDSRPGASERRCCAQQHSDSAKLTSCVVPKPQSGTCNLLACEISSTQKCQKTWKILCLRLFQIISLCFTVICIRI